MIIAIDPGPRQSACLCYDDDGERVTSAAMFGNNNLRDLLSISPHPTLVIEMVESFGMAVGKEVFETVFWIGRFCEAFPGAHHRIGRKEIKLHLCGTARAKDANVRQALIDSFPPTGGGKVPQIGTKKKPGPLYGISSHLWSALAVAVTWCDQQTPAVAERSEG